jgi:predicted Zn finger-like uncharacterized protein
MRLACPNCGAEYEVADDVIPESGRDVQCSNCGHTWFEQPGAAATTTAPAQDAAPEPDAADAPDTEDRREADPNPAPEADAEADAEPDTAPDGAPESPGRHARRTLDPEVAEILREEREREEAARRAEADRLESQPDLGLDDSATPRDQRGAEARRRMARLRGQDTSEPKGPAATAAAAAATVAARPEQDQSRRDLLPDIDEINSTLRSGGEVTGAPAEVSEPPRKSGGFRLGFLLVVGLAVVAALAYAFAPQIGERVPQLADPLAAYVAQVDAWRLWLDLALQDLMAAMEGTDNGPAAPPEAAPDVSPDPPATPEAPDTATE